MVLLWYCYGAATVVDRLRFLETLAEACEKGESEDGGRQGPAYHARCVSGSGNWDQPNHTTCRGLPLLEYPTYSAFRSVFGATCLRLQRLALSSGFGTTVRLGPRKNLRYSGVSCTACDKVDGKAPI